MNFSCDGLVAEEATKQGGKFHVMRRMSVSGDGKTMTEITTGTDQRGEMYSIVYVLEKQ